MPLERLIDVLEQLDQKHLILLELAKSKKKLLWKMIWIAWFSI